MRKVIEFIIVAGCMVLAFFVYKNVDPEVFIKPDMSPVSAADIDLVKGNQYSGRGAGDDIPRLTGQEALDEFTNGSCVTVEPTDIIETGVYGIKPWVDPYEVTARKVRGRTVRTGQRPADATDNPVTGTNYYQEYYLIELPDQSMMLAQFSPSYARNFKKGKSVTLPIGYLKPNSSETKNYLANVCEKYGVDDTYTIYMVNDEWQKENDFRFTLIRYGIGVVAFFVSAFVLVYICNVIFDRKGSSEN